MVYSLGGSSVVWLRGGMKRGLGITILLFGFWLLATRAVFF
jgi:hypothetical protein